MFNSTRALCDDKKKLYLSITTHSLYSNIDHFDDALHFLTL